MAGMSGYVLKVLGNVTDDTALLLNNEELGMLKDMVTQFPNSARVWQAWAELLEKQLRLEAEAEVAAQAPQAPPAEARSVSVWVVSEEANVLGVWRAEALGARHLWQLISHDAPVFAKRYEMAEWVLDGALADLEALERELPSMDDMQWELVVYGAKRLRHCAPMVARALAAAGLMGEEVGDAE